MVGVLGIGMVLYRSLCIVEAGSLFGVHDPFMIV